MAWQALAGAVAGAGGGITDWALGRADAKQAWRRQKKILQNQVSWRVDDMRRAGINPLMAVMGGSAGASAPMARGSGGTDLVGGARTAAETSKTTEAEKLIAMQNRVASSQLEVNSALASKYRAEARGTQADTHKKVLTGGLWDRAGAALDEILDPDNMRSSAERVRSIHEGAVRRQKAKAQKQRASQPKSYKGGHSFGSGPLNSRGKASGN